MSLERELGKKPAPIEMPPLPPEEPVVMETTNENPEQVVQETAPQSEVPQEVVQAPPQQILPQAPQAETAQAKNFRELRQQAERAQKERDEFEKRCRELEEKVSQKDDLSLSPNDLVEGKHIAQLVKDQREMKQKLQQYEQQSVQQRQLAQAESNLRAQYDDFDKVVNEATISSLKEKYPQTAEAIVKLAHDPQAAFDYAYMAIKMKNLAPVAPQPVPQYDPSALRAQQNSAKPRPLNTVAAQHTDSPISRMNAFAQGEVTPEMQKQLWKELNDARKGY